MSHVSIAAKSEYARLKKQMSSGEMFLWDENGPITDI
jgi:hypothetical protein